MVAVELVDPSAGGPDPLLTARALEECRRRGVLVGKGGVHGSVVRIAPPLSITDGEAEEGLQAIVEAVGAVGSPASGG